MSLQSYYKTGLKAVYEIGRFLKDDLIGAFTDLFGASDSDPTFTITKVLKDEGVLSEQLANRFSTALAENGLAEDEEILAIAKAAVDEALGQDGDAAALGEAAVISFGKKALDYGIAIDTLNATVAFVRDFAENPQGVDVITFAAEKNLLDVAYVAEAIALQLTALNFFSIDDDVSSTELAKLYTAKQVTDEASGADAFVFYKQSYVAERYFATDYV